MTEAPIDLKKLAEEAAREAYTPRAERCWPWSHRWTMWRPSVLAGGFVSSSFQRRRCLRCGWIVEKPVW